MCVCVSEKGGINQRIPGRHRKNSKPSVKIYSRCTIDYVDPAKKKPHSFMTKAFLAHPFSQVQPSQRER